jgi:hypothetical protein
MGEDEEARQARDSAATIDVSLTPSAPSPVPIPYPNVAGGAVESNAESPVVELVDRLRTELTDLLTPGEE